MERHADTQSNHQGVCLIGRSRQGGSPRTSTSSAVGVRERRRVLTIEVCRTTSTPFHRLYVEIDDETQIGLIRIELKASSA